jgi:hypothetical protein
MKNTKISQNIDMCKFIINIITGTGHLGTINSNTKTAKIFYIVYKHITHIHNQYLGML